MTATISCRLGRHRWAQQEDVPAGTPGWEKLVCRDCGVTGRRRKTILCRLGLHRWVAAVNEGAHYHLCRHCGKYKDTGAPFTYAG